MMHILFLWFRVYGGSDASDKSCAIVSLFELVIRASNVS
jgi:hypothetical protein